MAQSNFVAANQTYYDLANQRYQAGIDNYISLLDAQRQLFSSQQDLINVRLAQLTSEVNLYKALGGGWQATTPNTLTNQVPQKKVDGKVNQTIKEGTSSTVKPHDDQPKA